MNNNESVKIYKTGSAISNIQIEGNIINKIIRGLSINEVKAIKEGIKVLEGKLPNTILSPITINEKKETGEDSYTINYTQNLLKPWIDKEFISSALLLKIAYLIINQQTVLADYNLTLVDARPQNYWIFNKPYVLVDIGSIKPLNRINIESFRADFLNNFVYPLLIEKNLGIPISSYFKGSIQNFQINPLSMTTTWSSLTLATEFIRRDFIDFVSNSISASSPEFISYLNSISDKERNEAVFQNLSKPKKLFRRYKKIIDRVAPSKTKKSNWDKYTLVHNNDYTKLKLKIIDKFINGLDNSCKIADLGSNLTTSNDPRINLLVDNDLTVCRILEENCLQEQVVLLIDISEAMTAQNTKDFDALNCNGYINSAIVAGIMHHIIIDYGLCIEAFYEALSSLYENILLEYPSVDDPMVRLLLNKKNEKVRWDWHKDHLDVCSKFFNITNEIRISETRKIFFLSRK
tara:strand:- start:4681 stop:6066 length:1386 start_codon:yes stop_codon:yes gene_type:complete